MDVGAGNVCKFYGKCNRICWGGNSIWIRLAAGVSGEFICWWTIKLMKTKCCHCWWHRDGYVNVDELRCCCRARRFNVNGSSVDLNSCVRRRPWRNKTQIHEINPRPDLIRLYLAACVWVCVCVCVWRRIDLGGEEQERANVLHGSQLRSFVGQFIWKFETHFQFKNDSLVIKWKENISI